MNNEAYQDLWHFINERHSIYLKKEQGLPKPWTEDPILQNWKFCNVFRKLDKQSVWLADNVLNIKMVPELLLFNVFVFRAFNWYPTFLNIATPGSKFISYWDPEATNDILAYRVNCREQLTSGAYMLRGREGMPKYRSIVMTLDEIWQHKENLTKEIMKLNYLEHAWLEIVDAQYWGWGQFTAYQVVLDLFGTPVIPYARDVNDWTFFGPGANKGIREIWPAEEIPFKEEPMLDAAKFILNNQNMHRAAHVPELNLQDIEFCLCELGKYRRIKIGGRGKEKYQGT